MSIKGPPSGSISHQPTAASPVRGRGSTVLAITACIVAATLALGGVPKAQAAETSPDILLIGNSFSKGVARYLKKIFRNQDLRPKVAGKLRSGWTLEKHSTSKGTSRKIIQRDWDWILLQEQSAGIDDTRYPHARTLETAIAANGSATVFFMTWRDRGEGLASYDSLRGVPGGNTGYVPIAHELGAMVAPVGWAFRNVVAAGSPFDLWKNDGHHASTSGRYLASVVIYATLFGQSPIGVWAPRRLDIDVVDTIQQIADDTVFSEPVVWNLP